MSDISTDLTGLLEAIREHLDVPKADEYDKQLQLRNSRTMQLLGVIDSHLRRNDNSIDGMVEALQRSARHLPVDYPLASDCGEGCNSPADGMHDSCPGPHVGATVAEVTR